MIQQTPREGENQTYIQRNRDIHTEQWKRLSQLIAHRLAFERGLRFKRNWEMSSSKLLNFWFVYCALPAIMVWINHYFWQTGKQGENKVLEEADMGDESFATKGTVYFKNCEDCEYTLNAESVKVLIGTADRV